MSFSSIHFIMCVSNYLNIDWTTSAFSRLPRSRLRTVAAFNRSLYYKPNYKLRSNPLLTASYIGLPSSPSASWVLFFPPTLSPSTGLPLSGWLFAVNLIQLPVFVRFLWFLVFLSSNISVSRTLTAYERSTA